MPCSRSVGMISLCSFSLNNSFYFQISSAFFLPKRLKMKWRGIRDLRQDKNASSHP
jgi:hypothetical protein